MITTAPHTTKRARHILSTRSSVRAWLAASGVVCLTIAGFLGLRHMESSAAQRELELAAREIRARSLSTLEDQLHALDRMARRWESNPAARGAWEVDAFLFLEHGRGLLSAIELVDPERDVLWRVAIGPDGRGMRADGAAQVQRPEPRTLQVEPEYRPMVTGVREVGPGRQGLLVVVPFRHTSAGHLLTMVDLSRLHARIAPGDTRYWLRAETARGAVIYSSPGEAPPATKMLPLGIGQATWRLRVGTHKPVHGIGPDVVLLTGGLLALFLALVIRRSEDARKQSRQLAALVDSAPVGMLLVDSHGLVTRANPQVEALFGYPKAELLGMSIDELVPVTYKAQHERDRLEFVGKNEARRMGRQRSVHGLRRDGTELALEIGLAPILLDDGVQVLAAMLDVTERERSETALRVHAAALARSNAELEQFAYVASHDLQEPLRTVTAYAEMLAEGFEGALGDEGDDFIAHIVDGAAQMRRLILDLLTLSRVSNDAQRAVRVSVEAALQEALINLEAAVQQSAASVRGENLPSIEADRTQLVRVLQNLVSNALKFRGKDPPEVVVSATEDSVGWTFCVRDNGIGFDMAHAERIFRIGQRLHDRAAFAGSGIGLAIVKKIVETRGGRIWAESTAGQGARFFFTWPQRHSSERDLPGAA